MYISKYGNKKIFVKKTSNMTLFTMIVSPIKFIISIKLIN